MFHFVAFIFHGFFLKNLDELQLFFYPKASTPGCTKEACKFRDEYSVFKEAGAEVLSFQRYPGTQHAAVPDAAGAQLDVSA